jgi:uroporphyrinogen decarboxylase
LNDLFLKACRGEPVVRTPVWLMRQAGRYLPEYRALRERHDFLTLTRKPELAAEVTLQPIRRFGFDAAILFADILTPLVGHGIEVEFAPGPVVAKPFRTREDVERLRGFSAEKAVPETLETIRILKRELDVPLIGFVGAPFTLACYLVDGKGTKTFPETRALLYRDPGLGRELLDALADMAADYALAQVEAGADAIQVFDSWGDLHPDSHRPLPGLFDRIRAAGVPGISYAPGRPRETGADVASIDWRTPFAAARELSMNVQGNLDPMALFAPPELLTERIRAVLAEAGDGPGHVFNLGHGLHKDTPVESVELLVRLVAEETGR